jgi:hypothetical protein
MAKASWGMLGGALFLLSASCAPVAIQTDYERGHRFSAYRTYDWAPRPERDLPAAQPLSPASVTQARRAIDQRLHAKGFVRAEGGAPDFLVVLHSGIRGREEVSRPGRDWRRTQAQGPATREYLDLTIVMDVIDTGTGKLVWQGIARGRADGIEESHVAVDVAVEKLIAAFPPR